jgi:hypothetical protein
MSRRFMRLLARWADYVLASPTSGCPVLILLAMLADLYPASLCGLPDGVEEQAG